jgi:hypothetical protein
MTAGDALQENEPDFDAHALEDALQEAAAGEKIRIALLAVESHSELVGMIERLNCEDTGQALLAAVLADIRHQGRLLAP